MIKDFFSKRKVECPRCLGKGEVNWEDITRLKKELHWGTGTCAYCNGEGKVAYDQESKIAVDNGYLTMDLSAAERKRLIANDHGALQRAFNRETQTNNFVTEVSFLHFNAHLNSNQIFDFYMLHETEINIAERKELLAYINRIIGLKPE
jgi:hypothetical protein